MSPSMQDAAREPATRPWETRARSPSGWCARNSRTWESWISAKSSDSSAFTTLLVFSLFALLLVYPLAIIRALIGVRFFSMLTLHAAILVIFGIVYRYRTRRFAPEERVGVFAFTPLTFLMPITYALLTPLALFTLDTANWETRGHEEATQEPAPVPGAVREVVGAEIVMGEPAPAPAVIGAGGVAGRRRAPSHAQLPAA